MTKYRVVLARTSGEGVYIGSVDTRVLSDEELYGVYLEPVHEYGILDFIATTGLQSQMAIRDLLQVFRRMAGLNEKIMLVRLIKILSGWHLREAKGLADWIFENEEKLKDLI